MKIYLALIGPGRSTVTFSGYITIKAYHQLSFFYSFLLLVCRLHDWIFFIWPLLIYVNCQNIYSIYFCVEMKMKMSNDSNRRTQLTHNSIFLLMKSLPRPAIIFCPFKFSQFRSLCVRVIHSTARCTIALWKMEQLETKKSCKYKYFFMRNHFSLVIMLPRIST